MGDDGRPQNGPQRGRKARFSGSRPIGIASPQEMQHRASEKPERLAVSHELKKETGGNDLSELDAVDKAFGAHIVDGLRAMSNCGGSPDFRSFLGRDSRQQVFRGEAESPKAMVQALKGYRAQQTQDATGDRIRNSVKLPVIWYYRELGLRTAEEEQGGQFSGADCLCDSKKQAYALSMAKLLLSYRVGFLARDKSTAQRMALAWHFWISDRRAGNHKFEVPFRVQGERFSLECVIQDPQALTAENISLDPRSDERLFALQTVHEVMAPVLYGRQVAVVPPARWELGFNLWG